MQARFSGAGINLRMALHVLVVLRYFSARRDINLAFQFLRFMVWTFLSLASVELNFMKTSC